MVCDHTSVMLHSLRPPPPPPPPPPPLVVALASTALLTCGLVREEEEGEEGRGVCVEVCRAAGVTVCPRASRVLLKAW